MGSILMQYRIKIQKSALKFIIKQPKPQQERLLKAIYQLPDRGDIKMLSGCSGVFRLRVGDYRVIYTVDHDVLLVDVVDVGNCGDMYK